MPVYLAHGFRWPRDGFTGIRVHAIIHNLEECSVEYIQNDNSRASLLGSFRTLYPDIMRDLETGGRRIDFVEQYDPEDEQSQNAVSQPYAFVCDRTTMIAGGPNASYYNSKLLQNQASVGRGDGGRMSPLQTREREKERKKIQPMSLATPYNAPAGVRDLSANLEEVIAEGSGFSSGQWEALADLRDKLAEGEKIGWWVIYNGDPDRSFDDLEDEGMEEAEEDKEMVEEKQASRSSTGGREPPPVPPSKTSAPKSDTQSTTTATSSTVSPMPIRELPKQDPLGKDKQVPSDPSKLKQMAKTKGLRKKFFGKGSH